MIALIGHARTYAQSS